MKARVCQSRKSTYSIMNHSGFGGMVITRDGISVEVPSNWLFSDGRVKKYAERRINKMFALQLKEVC